MAIGTLAECYNNINVFRGVVKIRRGEFFFEGSRFPENDSSKNVEAINFAISCELTQTPIVSATGITAKVMQTKTISDVYGTFFDFSRKIAEKVCHILSPTAGRSASLSTVFLNFFVSIYVQVLQSWKDY